MRLSILAFAVCLLACSAQAQTAGTPLQCSANSGVPPVVRAEGYSELLGDLVITCTGGNPSLPLLVNVELFVNTNVTSRIVDTSTQPLSEALLMIDEPGSLRFDQNGNVTDVTTPFCLAPASGSGAAACNPAKPLATYQQGTYTAFRATRPADPARRNAVVWAGIPVTPPGAGRQRVFRITNVRANVQALGASQTLIPTQVLAYIAVSPQGTLPIDNPQQTVGYVQNGLLSDIRACSGEPATPGSQIVNPCSPTEAQTLFYDNPTRAGALPALGALRFREAFQTAFKSHITQGQSASIPGVVFNSESGFVRPESGAAGIADTGTRLAARFTNVPAGVRVFVATTQSAGTTNGSTAVLVPVDASGAPSASTPSATRPVPTAPTTSANLVCGNQQTPAVEVSIVGGQGLAVWEVTMSNPSVNETFLFTYGVAYRQDTAAGLPAVGAGLVSLGLAPFYPVTETPQSMQGFDVPVPRFVQSPLSVEFMQVGDCDGTAVVVTITSNNPGSVVIVDNVSYQTPKGFAWKPGDAHVLDAVTPQSSALGVRRRFSHWSDGGTQRKTITVPSQSTTYTANFIVQYGLTVSAGPGGTVGVSPSSTDGFYDAGTQIQISATPLSGYTFSGWTGSLAGQTVQSVTLHAVQPISATAVFSAAPCITFLSPASIQAPLTGLATSIAVSRPASCGDWTAASNQPWAIVTNGSAGIGDGTVHLTIASNPSGTARSASLMIAGRSVTITQPGQCAVSLNSAARSVSANDTAGDLALTSACAWTAISDRAWLQVYPLTGSGNATVSYTVFPNFSSQTRTGTIYVGDKQFTVTQQAGTGTADARFVRLLYFNYFGRLPVDAEIAFQLGSGQSRQQLAMNFLNSGEFNNAGRFVAGLYVGLLNRDPEYGGWLFQRNALSRGITNHDSIVANFLNGAEFISKYGTLSNAAFTTLLYNQILGRAPTQGEIDWRVGLLNGSLTRVAFARDVLNSPEFRQGKNARLLAFLVYATLLNRDPNATEFQQRRNQIAANSSDATVASILSELVSSSELQGQLQ